MLINQAKNMAKMDCSFSSFVMRESENPGLAAIEKNGGQKVSTSRVLLKKLLTTQVHVFLLMHSVCTCSLECFTG